MTTERTAVEIRQDFKIAIGNFVRNPDACQIVHTEAARELLSQLAANPGIRDQLPNDVYGLARRQLGLSQPGMYPLPAWDGVCRCSRCSS